MGTERGPAARLGSPVPATRHPALRPPRSPAPSRKGLLSFQLAFSISAMFNLPPAPWPHFNGSSLAMAASGSQRHLLRKYPNYKIPSHCILKQRPPRHQLNYTSTPRSRHRRFLSQKDIQEINTLCLGFFFFFIFFLDFFFPPPERNLPHINLDLGC